MTPCISSLKGLKILITGGLGFIGSNLAGKCLDLGAEVTIYDCMDPNSGGNMYNVSHIKDCAEIVLGNILNFDNICRYIIGKDIIFNCAASTSHSFSMQQPLIDIDVNSKGVLNLLEAVRRFNRDIKFVHLGTTTQIGRLYHTPADEMHPEFPTDIYSANKSASEKYTLIYGYAYNMPVVVIRLPNVFGPRAIIHSKEFNFVNYFIGLALQNKTITIYGDGAQLRNVLYVDDCVSALIEASLTEKSNNQVLFAVGDEHHSVAEIARYIKTYIGCEKVRFVDWPENRKATEVGDAVISNKKIKKILNWVPQYDFKTGLIKTKEYFTPCLKEYLRQ